MNKQMMKNVLHLGIIWMLLLSFSGAVFSQVTLFGKVSDAESGEILEAANVFIANTTLGTIANEKGAYRLQAVPEGFVQIVVSHLGYETHFEEIEIGQEPLEQNFQLKSGSIDLAVVNVTAIKDKKRKRYLKQFEAAFLGYSKNASKCTILNPEVINLSEKADKTLVATADNLIEIENKGLGYKIYFLLEHFEKKGDEITYSGKPYFNDLNAESVNEIEKWIKNRKRTYNGSVWHFFNALLENKTQSEGFIMMHARLVGNSKFFGYATAERNSILKQEKENGESYLHLKDFLQVSYLNEKDEISEKMGVGLGASTASLGQSAEKEMITQGSSEVGTHSKTQTSFLYALNSRVVINESGYPEIPKLLKEYGYWGYEGVADLLPVEYLSKKRTKKKKGKAKTQKATGTNEFDLANLSIPKAEIFHGGPPKDGIPSLDKPNFVRAEEADFMRKDELVLGIKFNRTYKAYPLRIMDYHEIVNDEFRDSAVVVTYCPLCGSGVAFNGEVEGASKTFGVSGLLYNNDVLLYDRETESLWSQILGEAVSGTEKGKKLTMIPSQITTWEKWSSDYPRTYVLTTKTGHYKNYETSPYERYAENTRLMFPVKNNSDLFPPKERVIGVEVNGRYKAYPFSELSKTTGRITDKFNGVKLRIYFDEKSGSIKVKNETNELVPVISLYWFAWFAFHPETLVYYASDN